MKLLKKETKMRILLAEDELALSRVIVKILEKNNYSTDAVYNGEDALAYIENGNYDAIILDVMMPKMDGFEGLRRVRGQGIGTPILILSAKTEIDDKVMGLDLGANDYLAKPFDTKELLARIRVITRTQISQDSVLTFGNISLNRATYELSGAGSSFRLANKEFQMMEMLMANPGHIISAERFMEKIWGYESDSEINVVWVYVSYLRKKLAALGADFVIKAGETVDPENRMVLEIFVNGRCTPLYIYFPLYS